MRMRVLLGLLELLLVIFAICLALAFFNLRATSNIQHVEQHPLISSGTSRNQNQQISNGKRYSDWRQIVVSLAKLPPSQVVEELQTKDPFGVRRFEKVLLEKESQQGSMLTMEQVSHLFPCPDHDRITLPDQRNHTRAQAFRSNAPGSFLIFQHLRKAGGTNFCTLAKENLPKKAVGHYYCMSDYDWWENKKDRKAGSLRSWSNEEIARRMTKAGHRVTGNEWDLFDRLNYFDLEGAMFATSFRRPMDRALSEFRFNCIEDRGCRIKDVGQWWKRCKGCYNIYTRTFADAPRQSPNVLEGNTTTDRETRAQLLVDALDTVAKLHLVLNMEWLAYAQSQVTSVLGFENTSALTRRVRPHIKNRVRNDGQDENNLGSAGIQKASWVPEEYLTPEQYKHFAEMLALDEILTDAARRIFLERLVCTDLAS